MAPIISKPVPKRDAHVEETYSKVEQALRPVLEGFLDVVEASLKTGGAVAGEVASAMGELRVVIDKKMLRATRAVVDYCFCDVDRMTRGGKSSASSLPTIFVLMLIVFLYNAFVFSYMPAAGIASNSTTSLIFHSCMVLLLASYTQASRTDPGGVPDTAKWTTFGSPPAEATESKKHGSEKEPRWCRKSNVYKPDRAHYCQVLERVVLRMDHHCPWIRNTVGFANHKFFFLFIAYASALCSYCGVSILQLLLSVSLRPLSAFVLMGNGMLALALSAILIPFFAFHVWLLTKNMTTIELCGMMRKGEDSSAPSKYDQGIFRNIASILGENPLLWCLPVGTPPGDGLSFPVNEEWRADEGDSAPEESASTGSSRTVSGEHADMDPENVHPEATPDFRKSSDSKRSGSSSTRASQNDAGREAAAEPDGLAAPLVAAIPEEDEQDESYEEGYDEWDEAADGDEVDDFDGDSALPDTSSQSLADRFFVWTSAAEFKEDLREGCLVIGEHGKDCCMEANAVVRNTIVDRISSLWQGKRTTTRPRPPAPRKQSTTSAWQAARRTSSNPASDYSDYFSA